MSGEKSRGGGGWVRGGKGGEYVCEGKTNILSKSDLMENFQPALLNIPRLALLSALNDYCFR